MLERATICPKYGARHAQSLSRGLIRSRRSLHSAFWAHGAGDIHLPSWWLEFLQRTPTEGPLLVQQLASTARQCIPTILKSSFLLNFLYPPKTLSLVKKILAENAIDSFERRQRFNTLELGVRRYTNDAAREFHENRRVAVGSAAPAVLHEEDVEGSQAVTVASEGYENSESSSIPLGEPSEQILGLGLNALAQRSTWYYRLLDNLRARPEYANAESLDVKGMLQLQTQLEDLRRKGRELAMDYARYMKKALLPEDTKLWTPEDFARIIKANYLASPHSEVIWAGRHTLGRFIVPKYFADALRQEKEGLAQKNILQLTLSFSDWSLGETAFGLFQQYRTKAKRPRDTTAFWAPLSDFDTASLGMCLISMSRTYRNSRPRPNIFRPFRPFSDDTFGISRDLMVTAILEFFNRPLTIGADPVMLREIWDTLAQTKITLEHKYYKLAIKQLLGPLGHPSRTCYFTIQAYRIWEQTKSIIDFGHDSDYLQRLFGRLRQLHHPGARLVFDDLKKCSGECSPFLYRAMLKELSYHGETEKYTEILNEFFEKHKLEHIQPCLAGLILAYGRRADLVGAEQAFESIESEHGLEPDISCWHAIMSAHARINGATEGLTWFSKMQERGVTPTVETYRLLLSLFCNRGEMDAAMAFVENLKERGHVLDSFMITSLVFGHIQNDDFDAAEKLLLDTTAGNSRPREMTRMWNTVLYAHALQGNMNDVQFLQQRMIEAGIPEDNMTHASLIQATSSAKFPNLGMKIIREVMVPKGLLPTSFHFAIIIAGYIRTKEFPRAFQVARQMKELGVEPDFSVKTLLIRAAVGQSLKDTEDLKDAPHLEKISLDGAERLLDYVLESENLTDISKHHPILGTAQQPLHEIYAANYFESLILIYGHTKALSKVSDLFDRYSTLHRTRFPDNPVLPPIRLLAALMVANHNVHNHAAVEECWTAALEKATPLACRTGADPSTQQNWVLPSRQFILSLPIYHYLRSLIASGRSPEIPTVLSSLLDSGFALDSKSWNLYIQTLCFSSSPENFESAAGDDSASSDPLPPTSPLNSFTSIKLAFSLAEKHLMPNWPGWPKHAGIRSPAKWLWKQAPHARDLRKSAPHYRTVVVLARAYMDLRSRLAFAGDREERMAELSRVAPRVVRAVTFMPRVDDGVQMRFLRGR